MGDEDVCTVGTGSLGVNRFLQHPANQLGGGTGHDGSLGAPVQGDIHLEIDARLPHRGADGVNPLFVDRFTSLERLGGQFAPRGGSITGRGDYAIRDGYLDLSGNLLNLTGLGFYDVGGGTVSGNLWSADGTLFNAEHVSLDADGVPRIYGTALGIAPFDDPLRIVGDENPYVFPFGLTEGGMLVCQSENRGSVTESFPVASAVRDHGIPGSWSVASLMALSAEMAQASQTVSDMGILELYSQIFSATTGDVDVARHALLTRQTEIAGMTLDEFKQEYARIYNLSDARMAAIGDEFLTAAHEAFGSDILDAAAPRGCRPDPNFDLSNMPDWLMNDPLSIVRNIRLNGDVSLTGESIGIPSILGSPAMTIHAGDGTNAVDFDISYHNPELQAWEDGERDDTILAALRHQREAHAHINTQFDIASVEVDGRRIALPLTTGDGGLDIDAQIRGLFPSRNPEQIWAQVILNGQVTLNGDIEIPADPDNNLPAMTLRRGSSPTQLSAERFIATVDHGQVSLSGDLNASIDLNMDPVSLDGVTVSGQSLSGMTLGGEQRGHLSVHADQQGILVEMGGRFALPTGAYPTPVPVAISRGYMDFEGVRLQLDPNIRINTDSPFMVDQLSGSIQGTIRLADLDGSVTQVRDGEDDRVIPFTDTNASVTIAEGSHFDIQPDRMDADLTLTTHVDGSVDGNSQLADLNTHLGIHDFEAPDGRAMREITLDNVGGILNGSWGDFSIRGDAGSFGDAPAVDFHGETVAPGVRIVSERDGLRFGRCATAYLNTQVSGLRVGTPQGTFTLTGQLVGAIELINISEDPNVPVWRPKVGGLQLELRGGSVNQGRTRLLRRGTLSITDGLNSDGQAEIRIEAAARSNIRRIVNSTGAFELSPFWRDTVSLFLDQSPASIEQSINGLINMLPENVRASLSARIIPVNPEAVQTFSETDSEEPYGVCLTEGSSMYYSPTEVDDVNISSIVSRIVAGTMTTVTSRGAFEVRDLQTNPSYSGSLRTTARPIRISRPDDGISGTITPAASRITISGDTSGADISISVGDLAIDVTDQQSNGHSLRYQGSLDFDRSIAVHVDIDGESIRIPRRRHPLVGEVTITETDAEGRTIGSGRVRVETNVRISGRASERSAHFSIHTPRTTISGTAIEEFTINGTTIPAEASFEIPIQVADPVEIDVNVRALLRGR